VCYQGNLFGCTTTSTRNEVDDYKTLCDPVLAFISESCTLSDQGIIGKLVLFEKYCGWCRHNNLKTVSQKKFNERLRQNCPNLKEDRNSQVRKWRGISWSK
jgi:phage/plasmid-associated DNA primase